MPKYRIFYDVVYRGDALDHTEDIEARTDQAALRKARSFIEVKNAARREHTREELIGRGLPAEQYSDEQLLRGDCFVLTGVSRIAVTVELVKVQKVHLTPIPIS